MSEELLQRKAESIGRYQLYILGATNLSQLRKENIITSRFSKDIANKKPDGILVLPGGDVKAVIEYKQPSELIGINKINKATNQMLGMAKQLCKLLIVTSGQKTFWINALNGEAILNDNGDELNQIFDIKPVIEGKMSDEDIAQLESLIDKIDHSLSETNNTIRQPSVLDPSLLAKTIWQKLHVQTGREPEKCLYNVVELFIFKFLSDIGVLKGSDSFQYVYNILETEGDKKALKHYANTCRFTIRTLFPVGEDRTTIINGTIFVNENGEANLTQAQLFRQVLEDLQNYDRKIGSFKYIRKEFKTRLYETFLREDAGIRSLGQFFTPRSVINAIIEMSNASELREGARICDPFCGVGGFILETIAANPHLMQEFEPKNGKVNPKITLLGYDKGSEEKEGERTIILAKANMLIYFSDLLVKYNSPLHLKEFSNHAFNSVFHLLRSNLGTFEKIDEEPFDLILTNPPYVTSGSGSLKKSIDSFGLSKYYTSGGRGTESLSLEWIVRNLKENGQAFIVVPDGLMNQSLMLDYVIQQCIVTGITSLPSRTFYSTPKKTYILALKKKVNKSGPQKTPVFTYLVSEIGETRDAKRFNLVENDLQEAVSLFNQFKGSPNTFKSTSKRCKIISFEDFSSKNNWMVDRWWSDEERIELGVKEEMTEVSESEFANMISEINLFINSFKFED